MLDPADHGLRILLVREADELNWKQCTRRSKEPHDLGQSQMKVEHIIRANCCVRQYLGFMDNLQPSNLHRMFDRVPYLSSKTHILHQLNLKEIKSERMKNAWLSVYLLLSFRGRVALDSLYWRKM